MATSKALKAIQAMERKELMKTKKDLQMERKYEADKKEAEAMERWRVVDSEEEAEATEGGEMEAEPKHRKLWIEIIREMTPEKRGRRRRRRRRRGVVLTA